MKDTLFRGCFSHPEVAAQFLRAWLPREFVAKVDWESLEVRRIVSGFFSDEHRELAVQLSAMLWTFLLGASELRREEVASRSHPRKGSSS